MGKEDRECEKEIQEGTEYMKTWSISLVMKKMNFENATLQVAMLTRQLDELVCRNW